jgi:hypothetical protein
MLRNRESRRSRCCGGATVGQSWLSIPIGSNPRLEEIRSVGVEENRRARGELPEAAGNCLSVQGSFAPVVLCAERAKNNPHAG